MNKGNFVVTHILGEEKKLITIFIVNTKFVLTLNNFTITITFLIDQRHKMECAYPWFIENCRTYLIGTCVSP